MLWTIVIVLFIIAFLLSGIRIVRPVDRGLIETFGKWNKRESNPGFHWVFPIIQRMIKVNITERMVDVEPQTVITSDKLNAVLDAVVYYQIQKPSMAEYNVDDHRRQLTSLARTTLRAVVGKMTLADANENRTEINDQVEEVLDKETKSYGVNILRVELQKIQPPKDVQDSMNEVVKAEQAKISAVNYANAVETKADGERRASIKEAEGMKRAAILRAEGQARAIREVANADAEKIKVVNQSIQKNFKNEAQVYKKLETTENALKDGSKYVVGTDKDLTLVMTEASGITPIRKGK